MNRMTTTAATGQIAPVLKPRKLLTWDNLEPVAKFLIMLLAIGIVMFALKKDILFNWEFQQLLKERSPFFRYLFIFNALVFVGAIVFRSYLWFKYRPYDSREVKEWPQLTVLVPSYNEGETVYKTICSIVEGNYPLEKLKIIAVDDGSKDDTYQYMEEARNRFPQIVELIKFPQNKGKREAIFQSFFRTDSPYIVTVDSDTKLEPDALKELITPLVLNPSLGAVTGRIRIWNGEANMLTKMLKANFAMAFDFTRAVQSTYSSVFCTSGAFSAYRSSTIKQIIHKWRTQTFLNQKCTYGEDRSLANHILRTGSGTAFQRTAIAHTNVPEKMIKILKMLTRWARSNIRESIVFSRLMFHPNRKGNYLKPFLEFLFSILIVFFHIAMFYYFLFAGFVNGDFILRAVAYSAIFGFFYMLYYIRIEGVKDFPYIIMFSIFSSVFMVWIFTIAGFTVTKKSWSTR